MNSALISLETEKAIRPGALFRNALAIAWIAAVFCLVILGAMVFQHATATSNDPWKSPQLLALKSNLQASPKDDGIKIEIREMDLKYRQRYFRRLALDRTGGWLLVGGIAVFLLAAKQAAACKRSLPVPQSNADASAQAKRRAEQGRWAVAGTGVIAGGLLAALVFTVHTALPNKPADLQKLLDGGPQKPVSNLPPLAEFQANWPEFRGPGGSGFSAQVIGSSSWDLKTGEGIAWKAPISAPGFNSPIVWKNRLFISGGTAEKREAFCYDSADGKLLWRRVVEIPGAARPLPAIPEQTGYAASTMATDGLRAFVIFASGDLAAINFDGSTAWVKNLGTPKNQYGHATSLAVWQDLLIVQLDQGESGPANSKLMAFDGASGRVVWEKSRPVASSWASPIVIQVAGKTQIITEGAPWVISYSATDGNELWRAELLEGEVTPSPVFAGGLVCVVSPSSKLVALRPDGSGDVTKTHVAWTSEDNIPDVSSPASNGELIFYVTSGGMLTCLDAKDGKKQWEHDYATEVQASPAIAGNRIYVLATNGSTFIAEAGRQFKELATCAGEDKFFASPAFANGRVYLRGLANLYCLGGAGPTAKKK